MNLLRPPPSADVYTWTGASLYQMCLINESPSAEPWANTFSWMGSSTTKHNRNGRHDEFTVTDRVLWSVAEYFEDLRHLPSGSQVHSEAWHGAACGQADYAAQRRSKIVVCVCTGAANPLRPLHFPLNLKLSVSIGRNFLNMFYWRAGGEKKNIHSWKINRTDGENLKTSNQKRDRRGEN